MPFWYFFMHCFKCMTFHEDRFLLLAFILEFSEHPGHRCLFLTDILVGLAG